MWQFHDLLISDLVVVDILSGTSLSPHVMNRAYKAALSPSGAASLHTKSMHRSDKAAQILWLTHIRQWRADLRGFPTACGCTGAKLPRQGKGSSLSLVDLPLQLVYDNGTSGPRRAPTDARDYYWS